MQTTKNPLDFEEYKKKVALKTGFEPKTPPMAKAGVGTPEAIKSTVTGLLDATNKGEPIAKFPAPVMPSQGSTKAVVGGLLNDNNTTPIPPTSPQPAKATVGTPTKASIWKPESPTTDVTSPISPITPGSMATTGFPTPAGTTTPNILDTGLTEDEKSLDIAMRQDFEGEGASVKMARDRLDREKALNLDKANRDAHDSAVRAGFQPGSAQYNEMVTRASMASRAQNIDAENKYNEFAQGVREDAYKNIAAMGERDYGRASEREAYSDRQFEKLLDALPSEKARELTTLAKFHGQDLAKVLTSMQNEDGSWKKEMTSEGAMAENIGKLVDLMEFDSPEEKAEFKRKTIAQAVENIVNPINEEGIRKGKEAELAAPFVRDDDTTDADFITNIKSATGTEWANAVSDRNTLNQIEKIITPVDFTATGTGSNDAFLRSGPWKEQGIEKGDIIKLPNGVILEYDNWDSRTGKETTYKNFIPYNITYRESWVGGKILYDPNNPARSGTTVERAYETGKKHTN
ncbi:MAG: hypothetical protein GY861_11275 [bacterium]|nr:hypothetical protein [bacterium]